MSPFLIMFLGMAIVLGMIIFLKVNPFISLITAAITVSLLAPGAVETRISRVAQAFGNSATQIGIVIALAAIIGQCMMESGAADRIVRAFMSALGEKRAPLALMGSGFVLAVPVFFDTVFYLLVPLARSLYRRVKGNFLLFIMAISAGGAITHTLVPPTPGPLVMADQLGIDIGTMILVGACVALPAAIAGLITARLMDRWIPIVPPEGETPTKMDDSRREPEGTPEEEEKLPGLFAAALPVLLPVVLISANTVLGTLADAEHAARFSSESVADWDQLESAINSDDPTAVYVREQFALTLPVSLSTNEEQSAFIEKMNSGLSSKTFFRPEKFETVIPRPWRAGDRIAELTAPNEDGNQPSLSPEQQSELAVLKSMTALNNLQAKDPTRVTSAEFERLNRIAIDAAFAGSIRPHVWNTQLRRAANVTQLLGNASLALLLSAGAAIIVWRRTRHPDFEQIAESVEASLMSGGAVILITAAGGAFGEMLRTAGIGDAISELFRDQSVGGLTFLLLSFLIAAILKVAQGSSTTAMIVTSAIMGAIVAKTELPFNVVYVATSIGAGSLIGSWMNDSGFWIVARMSGLTEAQALKTWTPLLIVLGIVSLLTTMLLATVLPLTG